MTTVLKRCAQCGRSITSSFVLCSGCEEELGIAGIEYRSWPPDVKELYRAYMRERNRERRDLQREVDAAAFYDYVTNGEPDIDSAYEAASSRWRDVPREIATSRLRCARCGCEFADVWPTFPLDPASWQEPACPDCGCGHLEEAHDHRADTFFRP